MAQKQQKHRPLNDDQQQHGKLHRNVMKNTMDSVEKYLKQTPYFYNSI